MAEKRTYPLLPDDPCLTQEQLFRYLDGALPPPEMHAVEKHLLDCSFCSDAVEGLQQLKERSKATAFVPFSGSEGTGGEEEKPAPVVLPLFSRRSTWFAIAASLVLIIGVTTLMKVSLSSPEMTANKQAVLADNTRTEPKLQDSIQQQAPSGGSYMDSQHMIVEKKTEAASSPEGTTDQRLSEADAPQEERADAENAPRSATTKADDYSGAYAPATMDKAKEEVSTTITRAEQPKVQEAEYYRNTEANAPAAGAGKDQPEQAAGNKKGGRQKGRADKQSARPAPAPSATGSVTQAAPTVADEDIVLAGDSTALAQVTDQELDTSYADGCRLLDSGQVAASLPYFDQVLQHRTHPHFEDAQWKKADALIRLNRKEEARRLLNEIVAKKGKYREQAKEKLKTL